MNDILTAAARVNEVGTRLNGGAPRNWEAL